MEEEEAKTEEMEAFNGFEGLDEMLGTNFVAREDVVEKVPALIPDETNHPLEEDKLYLMNQLKKLDHDLEEVSVYLKAEIKIGAKPTYHSVFTELIKAKLDVLKELRALNFQYDKVKTEKERKANGGNQAPTQVNVNANFSLTSDDLFALAESKKLGEAKPVGD